MPTLSLSPTLRLHYLDLNPGGSPTVLLLHGLGVDGSSWEPQFPVLQEAGLRVLAPDMRGFGASTYPGSTSIPAMARDARQLLEAVGGAPAHVAGISMGGAVALQMALDAPEFVNRLVLVNTFAQLKPGNPGQWVYFLWRMILVHTLGMKTQAHAVSKRLFPHPHHEALRKLFVQQAMKANLSGYRAAMRALRRFDVVSRLQEIDRQTLVVTSEEDTTVLPQNQSVLADGIPAARQVMISEAGHAVTVEKPEVFNTILLGFLTE